MGTRLQACALALCGRQLHQNAGRGVTRRKNVKDEDAKSKAEAGEPLIDDVEHTDTN